MDIVKFAKENYGDFVKRANPAMNKMTALQTLLSGKDLSKEEVPLIKEFKSVQEFLDLPMGDKKEVVLKKAFATAVTIAKDKGVLPFEVNSSEQIASLVDDDKLDVDYILPYAFDERIKDTVAKAVADAARKDGVARA